jgi:hypothetical protein
MLIVTGLYAMPLLGLTIYSVVYDFSVHLQYVQQWMDTGIIQVPHMLFHALVLGSLTFFRTYGAGLDGYEVAFLVCLTATMFLGATVFQFFAEQFAKETRISIVISLILMTALIIAGPITFFTMDVHNLYLGYIATNVFHNPTMYILKPLALFHFIVIIRTVIYPGWFRSVGWIVAVAILTTLSILAKPNYMLDLLPTFALCTLYSLVRRKKINWALVIFGVVVPAVMVLGWQEYYTYSLGLNQPTHETSSIIFAPFLVLNIYSVNLFPKFLLSILFPVSIYVLYFEKARRDFMLNTAWLIFIFGAIQMYFFAESGPRLMDGNFWWSAEIGVFILFAVSIAFLIKRCNEPSQATGKTGLLKGLLYQIQTQQNFVFISMNRILTILFSPPKEPHPVAMTLADQNPRPDQPIRVTIRSVLALTLLMLHVICGYIFLSSPLWW